MLDNDTAVRAGFGPRAAAFLLDRLLLVLALLAVRIPAWISGLSTGGHSAVFFEFTVPDILCYVLMSVYFVLLTYFTGSTLGKKVMGLHVEKEDGTKPSLLDVIYRETIGRYLSGILCLGYLMILADGRNRAFHDYVCDTRVVYNDRVAAPAPPKAPERNTDYTVPGEVREPVRSAPALIPEPPVTPEPFYTIPGSVTPTETDPEE